MEIRMGLNIDWHSQQGKRTTDNRDYCGVGLRDNSALIIVLDGSTSGRKSGEFVKQISCALIEWFISFGGKVSEDSIVSTLSEIHKTLRNQFKMDSASYVIAHIEPEMKYATIIHAGDCLLGLYDGKEPTHWYIKPHTLADITGKMSIDSLTKNPTRNRLTRSFRSREFIEPEITRIKLDREQTIILATDGFWAELNDEQKSQFSEGGIIHLTDEHDDISALKIQLLYNSPSRVHPNSYKHGNFYLNADTSVVTDK